MTAKFNMTRDVSGEVAYGLVINNKDGVGGVINYQTTLSANTEQNFTVPTSSRTWAAIFSFGSASVWVACNDTAEIPGSSFSITSSQMDASVRQVNGGDILSFITSATTAEICISLYEIDS